MRRSSRRWLAALLSALLALASVAHAQETGGSFGGGDWDEPAPPRRGSAARWDGTSAGEGPTGTGPHYPHHDAESLWERERRERERLERERRDHAGLGSTSDAPRRPSSARRSGGGSLSSSCLLCGCAPLFVGTLILWLVVQSYRRRGAALLRDATEMLLGAPLPRPTVPALPARSPARNSVDVTLLRLVIDWRSRRAVQDELSALARSGRTATSEGRVELLRATIALLRRARIAWLYAGGTSFRPMAPAEARERFTRLAEDARARFRRELVRADGATTRTEDAGPLRAKEHEGAGLVVLSLIVAARREIPDVRPDEVESIERLLRSLETIGPSELVALEVVWSPAAEDDRMSTAELEALYPDVTRIGGIGGRAFCGYCSGPFAMELPRCPHCGAPGPSAQS